MFLLASGLGSSSNSLGLHSLDILVALLRHLGTCLANFPAFMLDRCWFKLFWVLSLAQGLTCPEAQGIHKSLLRMQTLRLQTRRLTTAVILSMTKDLLAGDDCCSHDSPGFLESSVSDYRWGIGRLQHVRNQRLNYLSLFRKGA